MILRYIGSEPVTAELVHRAIQVSGCFNDATWRGHAADTIRVFGFDVRRDAKDAMKATATFDYGTPFVSVMSTDDMTKRTIRMMKAVDMAAVFADADWEDVSHEQDKRQA